MAGTKVNTKFVALLAAGIVLVCGMTAAAMYYLLQNQPGELISAGDRLMQEGKYKEAALQYSKAVNKDQTNPEYLERWIAALEKTTPETEVAFEQMFFQQYMIALRQLALVKQDEGASQDRYLRLRLEMIRGRYDAGAYGELAAETTNMLARQQGQAGERLRRYRGIVNARTAVEGNTVNRELLDAARADLRAALGADPADVDSALSLAESYLTEAGRARQRTRDEEAAQLEAQGDRVLDEFLAANPTSPHMLLAMVQRDLSRTQTLARTQGAAMNLEEINRQFVERNAPLLQRAADAVEAQSTAVSVDLLARFRAVEGILGDPRQSGIAERLARRGLELEPGNAALLFFTATTTNERGDTAGAMELLNRLETLPAQPVGMAGLMLSGQRKAALASQARWAVRLWESAAVGAERDAALARAKELRERLARTVPADDARLLIVDSQLALTQTGDQSLRRAYQLLQQYHRATNQGDVEALLLTAQVAVRLNEPGAARDALERVVVLQPNNVSAMVMLGDVYANVQNFRAAADIFATASRLFPDNQDLRRRAEMAATLAGQSGGSDPVVSAVLALDRLSEEVAGDPEGPAKIVQAAQEALAKNDDPRLVAVVANAHFRAGDRDKALEVVRAGLTRFPDARILQDRERQLASDDPVALQLQLIDESSDSELNKELRRYVVHRGAGNRERAMEALANAERLDPSDRRVVELRFIQHIESNELDQARLLSDRAVRENLDGVSGDTYRARVLAVEGRSREAAAILQPVVSRGGAQPEIHRLYGRMLVLEGRLPEATGAFREALRLRPSDGETAADLLSVLVSQGAMDQALAAGREHRRFGENNARFLELFLNIEGEVGDRVQAMSIRETIARTNPDNRENLVALAGLYMQGAQPDKARELIDRIRTMRDGIDAAQLDAQWHIARGDRAGAAQALDAYIATLSGRQRSDGMLVKAQFLAERGDLTGAMEAIEAAREGQDPATLPADRAASDLLALAGQSDRALEAARRVVDGNADNQDRIYAKRVIELLIRTGSLDEAQERLTALRAQNEDAVAMLLEAEVRSQRNDRRGQGEVLNQAVARFPTNPTVFIRRGQFLMQDENSLRDAIADLTKAIELAPANPAPLRLRATAYGMMKDERRGMEDLRAALRVNPRDTELLFSVMDTLVRSDRVPAALEVAQDAAQRRPRDLSLRMSLGAFFRAAGQHSESRLFLRQAVELDPSPVVKQAYLDALLDGQPDLPETQRVIESFGEAAKSNPGALMASARLRYAQGRAAEAARLAQDALQLLDVTQVAPMSAWYSDVTRMIPRPETRVQFLDAIARQGLAADWMVFFRAVTRAESPEGQSEAVGLFEQVSSSSRVAPLRVLAHEVRGTTLFQMGQYEPAVAAWRQGLELDANDPELLNNTAYILAKHLDRASEALPLAQRALELSPSSPDAMDTLGFVQMKLGQTADALALLKRAYERPLEPRQFVTIGLHYAEVLLASGDTAQTRMVLDRIQEQTEGGRATMTEQQQTDLQNLRDRLGP